MACSGGVGLAGQTTTDRLARGKNTLDWTTLSPSSDATVNSVEQPKNPPGHNPNTLHRVLPLSSSPSCRLTRTRSPTPSLRSTRPVLANYHPPYPSNLIVTNIPNQGAPLNEYRTTLRPPQNRLRNLFSVPSLPVRGIESSGNECSVTLRASYLHHQ